MNEFDKYFLSIIDDVDTYSVINTYQSKKGWLIRSIHDWSFGTFFGAIIETELIQVSTNTGPRSAARYTNQF